jgi:very-short-patch-repair endonuclease
MDMHLRVWSLNYRHPSKAEAYAFSLLSWALREPVLPQWPLPGGVADFAIPTAGIILEIDDKSHKAKKAKDQAKRDKWAQSGWYVVSCSDEPGEIGNAVVTIAAMIAKLPVLEIDSDSDTMLGSRVMLRGEYYRGMALKRAAKKLKKEAKLNNDKAKAVAKSKLSPARKAGGSDRKATAQTPSKAKA